MKPKIKNIEWTALLVATGVIDIFQVSIDLFFTEFFGAPEIVNEFIDAGVGIGLAVYFQFLRKVSLISHPSRLASLLGMEILTDITGGLASLWILEVWYIRRSVRQEEAQLAGQQDQNSLGQATTMSRAVLNQGGRREPLQQTASRNNIPFNQNGTRRVTRAKI